MPDIADSSRHESGVFKMNDAKETSITVTY
jgi:hypothetical protein